jgi:hypothetical protein
VETSSTEAVLDGDLDQFIEAFLMSEQNWLPRNLL